MIPLFAGKNVPAASVANGAIGWTAFTINTFLPDLSVSGSLLSLL